MHACAYILYVNIHTKKSIGIGIGICMYVCTIALLALRWALPDPSLR